MKYCDILKLPSSVTFEFENETVTVKPTENEVALSSVSLAFKEREDGTSIILKANDGALKFITLRWSGECSQNALVLGDAIERAYGNLEWQSLEGERDLPWYALLNLDTETVGYGVKVRPSAFCTWRVDEQGVTLILDTCNGSHGTLFNGREVELCTLVSARYEGITAYEAGVEFCKLMCTDGVFPKEKVYGSNNWYYAYGKSSEKEIKRDADYLAELTVGLTPRPYMVIDDCWQKNKCAGPWDELHPKFKDMSALAGYIKDKDLKPGIWLRPLCFKGMTFPKNRVLREFNDGTVLDVTVKEANEYVLKAFRDCRKWGYELIKFDFTTHDIFNRYFFNPTSKLGVGEWSFGDRSRTNAEIIVKFYKDIREASGDAVIIGCNTISHLSAGIFEMQRTGDDTSGKEWKRTKKMGFNTLAFRMIQHNVFYTVDADCVGITRRVPWRYNKEWLYILSRSGTPLFISSKKGVANKKQIEAIKEAFSVNCRQENVTYPINWQSTRTPDRWSIDGEEVKLKI